MRKTKKRLKFDKYYQVKNSNNDNKFKEDLEQFIQTNLTENLNEINKNLRINLEDLNKVQTEQLVEFIKEIKEETMKKCNNNPYYKMYYERLITELKLEEYFKEHSNLAENKEISRSKSSVNNIILKGDKNEGTVNRGKSFANVRENDEISKMKKEFNNNNEKTSKIQKIMKNDEDEFEDFNDIQLKTKRNKIVDEFDY